MADYARFIKISVEDYVEQQLSSTYTIQYPKTRFDTTNVNEWLRLFHLGKTPMPANGDTRVEGWQWQIDCLARVGTQAEGSTSDVWSMVDDVEDAFRKADVPVVNWDESSPPRTQVGVLEFKQHQVDPIPEGPDGEEGDLVAATLNATFDNL